MKEPEKAIHIGRNDETVLWDSPGKNPQSRGLAKRGVRSVKSRFRSLEDFLDSKLGNLVPRGHPSLGWQIEQSAFVLNTPKKGPGGNTPYLRLRGEQFLNLPLPSGKCATSTDSGR